MNRFLSFADSRMSAALERLGRQAEALDFFDEITLFTEHDLSAEFTSRMGRYLTPSCRGFGYWSWKPWSIHHVLQEMEEGDRLLYLDAGCHINANGTDRFREYVNMLDRDSCGMLVFTNGQPEYKWTKGDIFRHFGVSQEDGHITHTQQIAGGHVFLKKNPLTESLIRDWLHVFYDHLHLADNTPSASPNLPGFVENRYYAVTGIRLSPIHTGMKIKRPSCWEQPAAVHGILATWISPKRFSFRFVGLTADS